MAQESSELNEKAGSSKGPASSLENATAELNKKTLQLLMIRELCEESTDNLTTRELMELLLEKSMSAIGAQIGSVFAVEKIRPHFSLIKADTYDELFEIQRFRVIASKGQDLKTDLYIDINDSLVKSVIEEKKTLLIENIETDPRTLKTNDSKYGPPSFLSMPLFTKNRVSAVVNLARKDNNESFNQNDEQVLAIMLRQISLVLENSSRRSQLVFRSDKADTIKFEKEHEIRLKLEQVLRENEKKYRDLVDNVPVPLFEMSLKGKVIIANPACFKMFGYTRENFDEDANIFETMISPEDQGKTISNAQKVIKGQIETGKNVYRAVKKDGTVFPVRIYVQPIFYRSIPVGLRGTIIDVS